DVEGEIDGRAADARAVEGERADFEGELHAVVVFEGAIEDRFAVAGFADDAIWRAGADFDPVALRVEEVEFVLAVVFHLAADERMEIEVELAVFQRLLVFGGDAAGLSG